MNASVCKALFIRACTSPSQAKFTALRRSLGLGRYTADLQAPGIEIGRQGHLAPEASPR
jgi:hypothetical protein